jgi:hypothetical protein
MPSLAHAVLIDFESTPAGVLPADDQPLSPSTPYSFPGLQIGFGFDGNLDGVVDPALADWPVFEQAGTYLGEGTSVGFAGSSGFDTADPGFGAQLGNWFLRSPHGGSDFGKLVITYTSGFAVTAASGEIWDIDGTASTPGGPGLTEKYTVEAFDAVGNLLATDISPVGTDTSLIAPLDGQPWTFSFSGLTAGIAKITVDFTGTKPGAPAGGIGLAFNNFNPTQAAGAVPEPSGALLAAVATILFWGCRSNRRSGCA